jgi:carbamoyltransferase
MNILGISPCHDFGHDASAAIVCDGVLVAAVEEERFSREKHTGALPLQAIEFCLARAGLRMEQIDVIAYPAKAFTFGPDSDLPEVDLQFLEQWSREGGCRPRHLLLKKAFDFYDKLGLPPFNFRMNPSYARSLSALRERYGTLPRVRYYDHHLAHAASTYFTSGWSKASVVTIDGCGGFYSAATWSANEDRITRLQGKTAADSLGFFYNECTRYLGLGEFGDGKFMGLAPYGRKEIHADRVKRLLDLGSSRWYHYRGPPSEEVVGFPPRQVEDILGAPYPDFAASCQLALETAVANVVRSAIEGAQSRNVCLAGGVMLNCSSNGALLASGIADSIWVFPAAGDAGISVGAALQCAVENGELGRSRLESPYLGPDYSGAEIEVALRNEPRVAGRTVPDLELEVARQLAEGKVVGWFQGRMELGPRALGNRSILADPRTVGMRDRVNRIKRRELWRPLAPVVIAESASEYFSMNAPSPFMLFALQVRPEKRSLVPAIVHVDGSARPQTVTREQNSRLYELLRAFQKESGIPILLNTSFNDAGEPIVCKPQDAIRSYLAMDMDLLVLGEYLVNRKPTMV